MDLGKMKSCLEQIDKNILLHQKTLEIQYDLRHSLQKQIKKEEKEKVKKDQIVLQSHSTCEDEETAFYAASLLVSQDIDTLSNDSVLMQAAYNTWQNCLGS